MMSRLDRFNLALAVVVCNPVLVLAAIVLAALLLDPAWR